MRTPTSEVDQAAIEPYKADLKGMTLEKINQEINEVEDLINQETGWLEALCSRKRQLEPPPDQEPARQLDPTCMQDINSHAYGGVPVTSEGT